jgi:hypothetical protein
MPFTGQLGTPNSMLGNIVLGYGGTLAYGQTTLQGVALTDVGEKYDTALGFDPGTGVATMYGYMIAATGVWKEATQLQDTQKLIQAASAAATDRDFTYWPKVSQSDWSQGMRQLVFENPARFYQSNGLDVTKPGYLTLQAAASLTAYTMTGTYNTLPLVSDGDNWYLGISQGGHNLLIGNATGITAYTVTGGEILDMLFTPAGVVYGTATAIYLVTSAGVSSLVANEPISQQPRQSLAYFDENLYYITGNSIHSVDLTTGASPATLVSISANNWEQNYTCIASVSSGLCYSKGTFGGGPGYGATIIYTNNGAAGGETRIFDIPGVVKQIWEANGTAYIICQLDQLSPTASDYTMYTLTSSVVTGAVSSILDDNRFSPSDFLANNPSPTATCRGQIDADGRNVYIAWPGMDQLRLDLVSGGISQIAAPGMINGGGGYGIGSLCAHRGLNVSGLGMVHVIGHGTSATVNVCSLPDTTGTMITSYYDFTTPTLVKNFRGFEIDLFSPLPAGATVSVAFGLDASTTFTPMASVVTSPTVISCVFPTGTKASRIRYQITLTAGSGGQAPIITSWSTKASLGRVWKTTLSCKRNQMLRNGQMDDQKAQPQDLIANIYKAYQNAGKAIMFVPSPSVQPPPQVQGQVTQAGYAEMVNVSLEDYTWSSASPGARSDEQMPFILEGDMEITATEVNA